MTVHALSVVGLVLNSLGMISLCFAHHQFLHGGLRKMLSE
jgi:hypothetical protein